MSDIFSIAREIIAGPKHDLYGPVDPLTLVPSADQERAYYELAKVMGWPRHRDGSVVVDGPTRITPVWPWAPKHVADRSDVA